MKILRNGDNFRKMPERDMADIEAINVLVKQGWNYSAKSIYKEFVGKPNETKQEKVEVKVEADTKKVTKEKRDEKKRKKFNK